MRVLCAVLLVILPTTGAGQPIPRVSLRPANATLEAEFVGLTSLREIADGRIIVTDGRAQTLYLADFSTGRAEQLGRKGRGPAEWLNIGILRATQGDSSILPDWGNQRWLLLAGARIVGIVPSDHPAVGPRGQSLAGADRFGHALFIHSPPMRPGTRVFTRRDSNAVVFVDRRTGHADTIAQIRERPHRMDVVMDGDGRVRSYMPRSTEPNAQAEQAVLFNDGWLAIVRLEPLRVDWRAPNGAWTLGRPLPLRPEPVDAAERREMERRRAEARAEARKYGLPTPSALDFPTTLPIYTAALGSRQTPEGRLVIGRTPSARIPNARYLVINRRGTIDGELTLGARERLLGFGARSVYVLFEDDDDIQRIRRHPWP